VAVWGRSTSGSHERFSLLKKVELANRQVKSVIITLCVQKYLTVQVNGKSIFIPLLVEMVWSF